LAEESSHKTGLRNSTGTPYQDNICGLDVAVDGGIGMGTGQCICHGGRQARRLPPVHAIALEPDIETLPVDEIRNDVHEPFLFTHVMDRDDSGVVESCDPARFLEEAFTPVLWDVRTAMKHLDGHGAVELSIVPEVHRPKSTGSQSLTHAVPAKGSGRGFRDHWRR
jgi:hypothetical protein